MECKFVHPKKMFYVWTYLTPNSVTGLSINSRWRRDLADSSVSSSKKIDRCITRYISRSYEQKGPTIWSKPF